MPPSRHIRLTEEEDAQLREIEQDPYLKPKVRLRAQVLRLSNRGSNMERSPLTPAAPRRASLATSTAGESGAWRGWPTGPLRAIRRASPRRRGLHGGKALRGAHLERHATGRGSRGGIRDRGDAGGGSPASASRWATRGSAPATCPTNRRTPRRSAKPGRSWRRLKRGGRRRDRPEVPR